jgi:hypothetical protein
MRHLRYAAALTAALATLLSVGAATAAPQVTIMPPEIDFGHLEQHQVREGSLTIYNNGDETLQILDVKSTCGCTLAEPAVSVLAPGENTTLQVTFDSKTFQGQQHKPVTIYTNDPARGEIQVMVSAFVDVPVMVYPPHKSVAFNKVAVGSTATQSIAFEAPGSDDLAVEVERARADLFDVVVRPTPDLANRQEAVITVRADAPVGQFREIVSFRTGVAEQPFIDIETNGFVVSPLELTPGNVNFRYVGPGKQMGRVFQVRVHDGRDVTVTRAEIDLPGFQVDSIVEEPVTGMIKVTVSGTALPMNDERVVAAGGRMKGVLTLHTDDPAVPALTAEIKYMLKL